MVERFDCSCSCGYPLSVRIFDHARVVYFRRDGQPASDLSIRRCPKCRAEFPTLSPAEFKERVFRVP